MKRVISAFAALLTLFTMTAQPNLKAVDVHSLCSNCYSGKGRGKGKE
ncbi:MAG: hypothetical protein K2M03_05850 [Muribaculaceae bacterium]|nr:hypothetical protein [Muribaculaceae bacterium]